MSEKPKLYRLDPNGQTFFTATEEEILACGYVRERQALTALDRLIATREEEAYQLALRDTLRAGMSRQEAQRSPEGDDAQWDGTDAAHPAWWRGHDDGSRGMAEKLWEHIVELVDAGQRLRESLSDHCPGIAYIDAWDSAVAELPQRPQDGDKEEG
jgi:Arc/MetJ family transcription regulator